MKNAFIAYRSGKTSFEIPSEWNLLTFASFSDKPKPGDVKKLTRKALRNPIKLPPLKERLSPSDRVAIIIEDITRSSPKKLVLEILLEILDQANIPGQNVTIIVAIGTHRRLTSEELETTFGRELLDRYEFTQHDCHAPDLEPVGRLRTGREVKINRKVHEATFKIGIGSILPHGMNGFGGGGKIVFPGVADFSSIREHHLYTFHEGTGLGRIKENLFYKEVSSIARSAELSFIINSILDQNGHVVDMVAGDPIHAHLAGIEKSRGIISQRFAKKSDITLISSFPNTEGPQIMKALAPAKIVTKEGGCIILAAECTGNLPDVFVESFERFRSKYGDNLLKGVLDHFENNRLIMEDGAVDFNMALGSTLAAQQKFKIILVSGDVPREKCEKIGFIYAEDLEDAFELCSGIRPHPEVHIIASGGIILPVL